jgi:DNA ligase D-like protein (predicted polymerase)
VASPFVELEVGERVVKVTNPDKVYYSTRGETKLDHVRYYLSVGDGIVRALYERPTQLKRHPGGAESKAIYQKRVPEGRPEWIEVARVTFPSGRHADELCITELAQVAWAANLGTIDFHPWPSRRAQVDNPDELRIDVDPQPGTTFADGKRVAGIVREVLDELGYVGWPKTSGNRGIHIAVRIEPRWEFPVVRRCALAFAREIERRAVAAYSRGVRCAGVGTIAPGAGSIRAMISGDVRIFVCTEPIDMRYGFDRLAAAARERVESDPMSGALFVFANRRATRLKVLWFDRNGYCLLYKRLNRAVFDLPIAQDRGRSVSIERAALAKLLAGVEKPVPHRRPAGRTVH